MESTPRGIHGGLAKYQDRYDMLKPVVKSISKFFLKHL
jgi:hypothetical protein